MVRPTWESVKGILRIPRVSLRRRVFLLVLATIWSVVVLLVYPLVSHEHERLERDLKARLEMAGWLVARSADMAAAEGRLGRVESLLAEMRSREGIEAVWITDETGGVRAGAPGPGGTSGAPRDGEMLEIGRSPEGYFHEKGHRYLASVTSPDGYRVHLIGQSAALNRAFARRTWRGVALALGAGWMGLAVALYADRRLRRALGRLIDVTRAMSEGRLDARVELRTGDEIEELAGTFNRMADSLAEREGDLAQAHRTLRTVFDGIQAGISLISPQERLLLANRFRTDLAGGKRVPQVGGPCYRELWGWEQPCAFCPAGEAVRTRAPASVEIDHAELEGGRRRTLLVDAYPVDDDEGGNLGVIEYVRDISDRKKYEERLEARTEELERAVELQTRDLVSARGELDRARRLAALGELLGGVAHEMNNPLGTIATTVKYLMGRGVSPEIIEDLRKIDRNSDRVIGITRSLLAFGRHGSFEKRSLDIGAVVAGAVDTVSERTPGVGAVEIDVEDPGDLPMVLGNAPALERVFVNLLDNALDACQGRAPVRVVLRRTGLGGRPAIDVAIEDRGPGVPAGLRDRIFEPFFTRKGVGKGSGLGLSVSYGIVRDHGGTISVESPGDGRGARFRVRLPTEGTLPAVRGKEREAWSAPDPS